MSLSAVFTGWADTNLPTVVPNWGVAYDVSLRMTPLVRTPKLNGFDEDGILLPQVTLADLLESPGWQAASGPYVNTVTDGDLLDGVVRDDLGAGVLGVGGTTPFLFASEAPVMVSGFALSGFSPDFPEAPEQLVCVVFPDAPIYLTGEDDGVNEARLGAKSGSDADYLFAFLEELEDGSCNPQIGELELVIPTLDWEDARAAHTWLDPQRINYAVNPSFEASGTPPDPPEIVISCEEVTSFQWGTGTAEPVTSQVEPISVVWEIISQTPTSGVLRATLTGVTGGIFVDSVSFYQGSTDTPPASTSLPEWGSIAADYETVEPLDLTFGGGIGMVDAGGGDVWLPTDGDWVETDTLTVDFTFDAPVEGHIIAALLVQGETVSRASKAYLLLECPPETTGSGIPPFAWRSNATLSKERGGIRPPQGMTPQSRQFCARLSGIENPKVLESQFFPTRNGNRWWSVEAAVNGTGLARIGIVFWNPLMREEETVYVCTGWYDLQTDFTYEAPEDEEDEVIHQGEFKVIKALIPAPEYIHEGQFRLEFDGPGDVWVDNVLIEPNEAQAGYFDGEWEFGQVGDFTWYTGTGVQDVNDPHKTYSLFYNNRRALRAALLDPVEGTPPRTHVLSWVPEGASVVAHWDDVFSARLQSWIEDVYVPILDFPDPTIVTTVADTISLEEV
jgi:hypothetical protein